MGTAIFHPFVPLMFNAKYALGRAKENEEGSYYESMTAIVFSALAIEAFLNHVGYYKRIEFWKILEFKLNPQEKLQFLCQRLKLKVDRGDEPYQYFKTILNFRNSIAHAKVLTEKVAVDYDSGYPRIHWEKMCNPIEAGKLVCGMEAMIEDLAKQLGLEMHLKSWGDFSYRVISE
ncbi:MAG: hypothetical protein V1918_02575 [Planctomycetota bacterium]